MQWSCSGKPTASTSVKYSKPSPLTTDPSLLILRILRRYLIPLCTSLIPTHPVIELHNGLIRRFIPNGKRIDNFTSQQISDIETWCNCLPRKILGYRTPDEVFEDELDQIYKTTA